jgi:hypothetical protein
MSQPFSRLPEPEVPRPFKRRNQPGAIVKEALQTAMRVAQQHAQTARRYGEDLWRRGKRRPRALAAGGTAVAVTLIGAYALSASGGPRSLCPSTSKAGGKASTFLVLMDPVPPPIAGSGMEVHYDVCGLSSRASYHGRIQLTKQVPVVKTKKKKNKKEKVTPQPKPIVVSTFEGKTNGVASRESQDVELRAINPGTYTMELKVVDNKGRERKRVQKLVVKPR